MMELVDAFKICGNKKTSLFTHLVYHLFTFRESEKSKIGVGMLVLASCNHGNDNFGKGFGFIVNKRGSN